jgi:hypothetical protein
MFAPPISTKATSAAPKSSNLLRRPGDRTAAYSWLSSERGVAGSGVGPSGGQPSAPLHGMQASWNFSRVAVGPGTPSSGDGLSPPQPRLPGFIQAKLKVGAVDDPLEREADGIADQVLRMSNPEFAVAPVSPRISRKCLACEEEELQRKPAGKVAAGKALGHIDQVLRSPGQRLDDATRGYFEPRFGQDFSSVRVHSDARSAESAQAVRASAYTVGQNIVFGAGAYDPGSASGRRLLAHELVHTLQQRHLTEPPARDIRPPVTAATGAAGPALQRQVAAPRQDTQNTNDMRRVTKLLFDKKAMSATYYFEEGPPETRYVIDHCDPVPGAYRATVLASTKRALHLDWFLPPGVCGSKAKGFVLKLAGNEPAPGTLEGATAIDVEVFGDMVSEFLQSGWSGVVVPADSQARLRIAEMIVAAGLTRDDLVDYSEIALRAPRSWNEFEVSFTRWLSDRQQRRQKELERKAEQESRLSAAMSPAAAGSSGQGLEPSMVDIYKDYRKLALLRLLRQTPAAILSLDKEEEKKIIAVGPDSYERTLRSSVEKRLKDRYDIKGIPEFEQRIGTFELSFRNATVGLAERVLNAAERVCDRFLYEVKQAEGTRRSDEKAVHIVRQLAPVRSGILTTVDEADRKIKSAENQRQGAVMSDNPHSLANAKASLQAAHQTRDTALDLVSALLPAFPFIAWPDFPREKLVRLQDPVDVSYLVNWYLIEHIAGIQQARHQLDGDNARIYKLDALLDIAENAFGIAKDSIFDLVIQREVRAALQQSLLDEIKTVVQFALLIVSIFVPGGIGVAAAIGTAAISADQAVDMYKNYMGDHADYKANLRSTDPSQVWVVVAIIGAGLDAKGAVDLLDKLPALRKAVDEFKSSRSFERLSQDLDAVKELDATTREAIKRDAEKQVGHTESPAEASKPGAEGHEVQSPTSPTVARADEVSPQRLQAELTELHQNASDPAKIHRPVDRRYDVEMEASDGHEFRRDGDTGLWERCSRPPCKDVEVGPELDIEVDETLETMAGRPPIIVAPRARGYAIEDAHMPTLEREGFERLPDWFRTHDAVRGGTTRFVKENGRRIRVINRPDAVSVKSTWITDPRRLTAKVEADLERLRGHFEYTRQNVRVEGVAQRRLDLVFEAGSDIRPETIRTLEQLKDTAGSIKFNWYVIDGRGKIVPGKDFLTPSAKI